jgi:alkylated DNA repair dioxygenase AlkB
METVYGLSMIPNFITEEQEIQFLTHIDEQKWNTSLSRRTQHYGYVYGYGNKELTPADPIPQWIAPLINKLSFQNVSQVIINEYLPGQGISKHTDHERLFGPVVASLTLNSPTTMIFREKRTGDEVGVRLERRSLVVLEKDARYTWTHEISPKLTDTINGKRVKRGRRVSITFRSVC